MFEKVYGQEGAKKRLELLIKNNKIHNAMIFSGQEGVGKRLMAREFASEIIGIDVEDSSDFDEISSGDSNSIKIDAIRELNKSISLKPYSKYRVYLIDEAEKLTLQAQNALLKTLEECPDYGIIILVTKNELSLLETIRSRCMEIRFSPLSNDDIERVISDRGFTNNTSDVLAFCSGSASKAIEMCESEDIENLRKRVDEYIRNVLIEANMSKASEVDLLFEKGNSNYMLAISMIRSYIRDACIVRECSGNIQDLIVNKDRYKMIFELAENISLSQFGDILDVIEKSEERLLKSPNVPVQFIAMSTRICRIVEKNRKMR